MKEVGIHAIIQKINTDAEQHSNEHYIKIKNETDKEIEIENELYCDELSKRREMLQNHNEHEYALLLDRLSSRFNRELLNYRRSLIDDIFDMAASKLTNVSEKEFSDMFSSAVSGLSGNFTLYIGELSKGRLDMRRIEEASRENTGLIITLSPKTIPKKSGFLLNDDRVEYNCLFEDLIENMKSEQATLILKEVFGDLLNGSVVNG